MNFEHAQIKSNLKKICEDYFITANESVFAAMDGSTPICDFQNSEGMNGAALASRIIGNSLKENAAKQTDLTSLVTEANAELLRKTVEHGFSSEDKHESWNTCLSLVRVSDEYIEYAQIGDCMIFAIRHDGTVETLSTDTVFGISPRAKQERARIREHGFSIPSEKYYSVVKNSLSFNRYLANKPNGYGVLNGDPKAIDFLTTGKVERKHYRQLVLISDGLFPEDRDWTKMVRGMNASGLHQYVSDLVAYEEKHNLYQDDKTVILLNL